MGRLNEPGKPPVRKRYAKQVIGETMTISSRET
jgi:hypothetical protein